MPLRGGGLLRRSVTLIMSLSFILIVMLVILPGCKKRGASEGPGVSEPVATPIPTPEPTPSSTSRYDDEIDEATEIYSRDSEEMVELEDINFEFDQYSLTFDARETLAQNAIYLKRNKSVAIQIEGHCDERGTVEYNLALGQKRADATKNYLVSMGIDASRIMTISYGEERPLDPDSNEYAWAKNRRAHFEITSR